MPIEKRQVLLPKLKAPPPPPPQGVAGAAPPWRRAAPESRGPMGDPTRAPPGPKTLRWWPAGDIPCRKLGTAYGLPEGVGDWPREQALPVVSPWVPVDQLSAGVVDEFDE